MLGSFTGTGKVYVQGKVEGHDVNCLLDSGSEITIFPKWLIPDYLIMPTNQGLHNVNGSNINLVGETQIRCEFANLTLITHGVVSNQVNEVMFGHDFLSQNKATWDFANATLTIGGIPLTLHDHGKNPEHYTGCHAKVEHSKFTKQDDAKFCPRNYLKMCLATLDAADSSPTQKTIVNQPVTLSHSVHDDVKTDQSENQAESQVQVKPDADHTSETIEPTSTNEICETRKADLLCTSHHVTGHCTMPNIEHVGSESDEPASHNFEWLPNFCEGMTQEQREWCAEYSRDPTIINRIHGCQQIQVGGGYGNG